jgi:protein-tyrosine sulfotransferase
MTMGTKLRLEEPILVGGCGSSGTTLLRHLINIHPNIYCGPELSILNKRLLYHQPYSKTKREFAEYLRSGFPTYAALQTLWLPWSISGDLRRELRFFESLKEYNMSPGELIELANRANSYQDLLNVFFESVLNKAGKTRWAEKTPTNCYCIEEFLSSFPNGFYIHVVRDGRDVIPSLMKRGLLAPMAVRRWMYDTATGFKFREHPRFMEVHYEELVSAPKETIQKLFNFIGEEIIDDIFDQETSYRNEDRGNVGHSSWTLQPSQSISTAAVGKWMTDEYPELLFIKQLFKHTRFSIQTANYLEMEIPMNGNDLLKCFGYDPNNTWYPKSYFYWKIIRHYLRELRGRERPKDLKYFKVSLL